MELYDENREKNSQLLINEAEFRAYFVLVHLAAPLPANLERLPASVYHDSR